MKHLFHLNIINLGGKLANQNVPPVDLTPPAVTVSPPAVTDTPVFDTVRPPVRAIIMLLPIVKYYMYTFIKYSIFHFRESKLLHIFNEIISHENQKSQ